VVAITEECRNSPGLGGDHLVTTVVRPVVRMGPRALQPRASARSAAGIGLTPEVGPPSADRPVRTTHSRAWSRGSASHTFRVGDGQHRDRISCKLCVRRHERRTDPRQRRPVALARFHIARRTSSVALYPIGPDAPAGARALSPQDVAGWLLTTNDARVAFRYPGLLWPAVRQREQRGYQELVVLLAGELYHRERGALPPSDEALVGAYLESLPDDGSADLADEMTPTVE
jgi:hypothetical protein